jgi:hypothetical protein
MEHTVNPQGIAVNGKSRLTAAFLEGDPEAKAIQTRWARRLEQRAHHETTRT